MKSFRTLFSVFILLALTILLTGCATPFQKRLSEARNGNPQAQFEVALCYYTGRGIGPKGLKDAPDPEEAVQWLEKAEAKVPAASLALGLCYYYRSGVRKDWDNYQTAYKYIKKAADKNVPGALYWLGECYLKGRGVDQNAKTAIDCFKKCSLQTNTAPVQAAASMSKLGNCYLHGTGGPSDYRKCYDWFKKAKQADDREAAEMLENLTQEYYNKVQRLGGDTDGGANLYMVERSNYDPDEDSFAIFATPAKNASPTEAAEVLKRRVLARCEEDLVRRVPGLDRSKISFHWVKDSFDKKKIDLKLIWYYLHVVPGSEKYDKASHMGSLEFDTAEQSETDVQKFIAKEINAFCSTKLSAVADGTITKGTMYREIRQERKKSNKRLLVVTFEVLN